MSKIFELFGYRLDTWGPKAEENCQKAWCPFMDSECDGGGNRHSSAIDLRTNSELAQRFPGKQLVQSGVCSLRIRDTEQPWIVCPRRLLSLRENSSLNYQDHVKKQLSKYMEILPGKNYRVWSEVKMKVGTTTDDEQEKFFDYTFDYVIAGSKRLKLSDVAKMIGSTEKATLKVAHDNGYTLVAIRGDYWIDNFPSEPIIIVEIMTSSTSGGDKKKRTQVGMAFEDAILKRMKHNGPGINYRQVWARMVSQLIVKSQVGMAWNGKTIWLIQDVLAKYISSSTALDLSKYLIQQADEVNILAFGYGDKINTNPINDEIMVLDDSNFYSGPITAGTTKQEKYSGFVEIIKIGAPPPKEHLWYSLFFKKPCAIFTFQH